MQNINSNKSIPVKQLYIAVENRSAKHGYLPNFAIVTAKNAFTKSDGSHVINTVEKLEYGNIVFVKNRRELYTASMFAVSKNLQQL